MPNAFSNLRTNVSNLKIENPYDFDFDEKRNVNAFVYVLCDDATLKFEEKRKKVEIQEIGKTWESRKNGHAADTNPRQCVKSIFASRSPTIDYGIDKI